VVVRAAQVRTVGTANLRSGAPSTSAPLAGKLPAGTIVNTAGIVPGEKVQGNFNWYLDGRGNFLWAGATDQPQPGTAHSVSTDELELSRGGVETVVSSIPIDRKKFALPRSQFNDDVTTKDLIVLHFTAGGSAKSAFSAWTSNAVAVATAYLVDVDGQIYETFDPSRWAFHLGIKATHKHDRRSIGIEIANVGPLKLSPQDPNVLNWWPPEEKFLTKFCGIVDTDKYVKQRYRNFDFYAAFPEAQVESVVQLVHQLCDRFNITRAIPPQQKRAEFDMAFFDDFKGIATHSNFRSDKSDIGPAFDWSRLGM
jgi:N-acetyl-anhydromuramyl-L-alanine amidase AmpD